MIQIELNGEPLELAPCTLNQLLESRGWLGKRIAVERNGEIVPRSLHASTHVLPGDCFEIVVAVGGG